mgnify:CR=1 FL=1
MAWGRLARSPKLADPLAAGFCSTSNILGRVTERKSDRFIFFGMVQTSKGQVGSRDAKSLLVNPHGFLFGPECHRECRRVWWRFCHS